VHWIINKHDKKKVPDVCVKLGISSMDEQHSKLRWCLWTVSDQTLQNKWRISATVTVLAAWQCIAMMILGKKTCKSTNQYFSCIPHQIQRIERREWPQAWFFGYGLLLVCAITTLQDQFSSRESDQFEVIPTAIRNAEKRYKVIPMAQIISYGSYNPLALSVIWNGCLDQEICEVQFY
jgi:Zn finger protein HypA/HybF involved in hydrogenase expression